MQLNETIAMESAPQEAASKIFVSDPIYDLTQKPAVFDKSTAARTANRVQATANGAGDLARSGLKGSKTQFNLSTQAKLRFDTSCLLIRLAFSASATALTNIVPGTCAPSYDLIGRLIQNITFTINGTKVFDARNRFYPMFMARCRKIKIRELEQKSWVFGPIQGDKHLLKLEASSAKYDTGVVSVKPGVATESVATYVNVVGTHPVGDDVFTVTAGADTAAFFADQFGSGAAYERSEHWIGADSASRVWEIALPFSVCGPEVYGVLQNMRNAVIDIQWTNETDLLEKANAAAVGHVLVTNVEILTDEYSPVTAQQMEAVAEKSAGVPDIMKWMDCECDDFTWTGSADFMHPNVKNFDSVMIFQSARDVKPTPAETVYQSSGQLMLLTGGGAAHKLTNSRVEGTAGYRGPDDIQLLIGSIQYPAQPIELIHGSHISYAQLWAEYLKSIGCMSAGEEPMSYKMFSETMTCAYIRPWAPGVGKLSGVYDLRVRMRGTPITNAAGANAASRVWVCIFTPKAYRLNPNGTCDLIEL